MTCDKLWATHQVRRAIAGLDAGRGKFGVVDPDEAPQAYEESRCSPLINSRQVVD